MVKRTRPECCGKPRSGNFCLECGQPLKGPLYTLLTHLTQRIGFAELRKIEFEEWLKRNTGAEAHTRSPTTAYIANRRNNLDANLAKWTTWKIGLEELLVNDE